MNSIVVIFHDSNEVIRKLKALNDIASNSTKNDSEKVNYALLDLFKALVNDVNLGTDELNDSFMLNVFNTRKQFEVKNSGK